MALLLFLARSAVILLTLSSLFAQSKPSVAGDYAGVLGGILHLKLHIKAADDGALSGALDSIDQGAMGIPCADFKIDGANLSFRVPAVNGTWKGKIAADGSSLSGKWNQGADMDLAFSRETFVAAEKPSGVDGIWLGTAQATGRSLRAQITVKSDRSGREYCTFDSLDQLAGGWECTNAKLNGSEFSFEISKVKGRWSGKLSDDQQTLSGSWNQGREYPLNFSRQTASAKPRSSTDPAMPSVKPADIQGVLDGDLASARSPIFIVGPLAEGSGAGLTIGVVSHGVRSVFAIGSARLDSIFEIGSVTKTFTSLILARMVAAGKVTFDEPVRELLPPGTVAKPEGAEITLLDLAIQHSGLPRMPDNFSPSDPENPYADYRAANLYKYLASQGVAKPASPPFVYSNLGVGLLGQALANRAGVTYAELLQQEIAGPLGMKDTVISLSKDQQARFIQGRGADSRPARAWNLDALAGAGAIRSTAADMLTYLEAQLHPDKFPALASAIAQTHELRADAGPGMRIGLNWIYSEKPGFYWHNGGTGGYSSFAFFDPKNDCAAVVLFNQTVRPDGSFPDLLGAHIHARLIGEAPISLVH